VWISLALLFGGLVIAAPYVVTVFSRNLNAEAFTQMVAKLVAAGNPDRALRLAEAAGRIPLAMATRAALVACRSGVAAFDDAAGYREGASPLVDAIVRAYRGAFAEGYRPVRIARWGAVLALPLLGAVVASPAFVEGVPPLVIVVSAVAAFGLGLVGRIDIRIKRDADRTLRELMLHFERLASAPSEFSSPAAPETGPWR
jgi:hypothetical protein